MLSVDMFYSDDVLLLLCFPTILFLANSPTVSHAIKSLQFFHPAYSPSHLTSSIAMPPQCQTRSRPQAPPKLTMVTRSLLRSNDPPCDVLASFRESLQAHNLAGEVSSFDPGSKAWVEWSKISPGPTCPHILNKYRSQEDCTMSLYWNNAGTYWKAKSHPCDFTVAASSLPSRAFPHPPGVFRPFFSRTVARRRAMPDLYLIKVMTCKYESGIYNRHPEQHPLQQHPLPSFMARYCSVNTSIADHGNLQFFDSPIGIRIRLLHATTGLIPASLRQIQSESRECSACHCVFSIDGYNAHLDIDNICCNWYKGIPGECSYIPESSLLTTI
ncbi:uncharacterized protein ARMOST_21586 [Armillaria ostoyae]|uniref:Uncharacterized protein n=1 Tax=Armillaria ostoyae TaxID=47428 RepID=A0A284SAL3_ARMOS|nr:uncharacterized protein ARMOST_21586 [Armillaria ostoyae]